MNAIYHPRISAVLAGAVLTLVLQGCSQNVALPPKIMGFGPKIVKAGQPFHKQPDGTSAMWVKINGDIDKSAVISLGGVPLKTVVKGDLATALVPAPLYAKPGSYPILLNEQVQGKTYTSNTVQFTVN